MIKGLIIGLIIGAVIGFFIACSAWLAICVECQAERIEDKHDDTNIHN